jgi:hypothetical protein
MSHLTNTARKLRASQTEAEKKLWSKLRNRQFMNLKFRRQQQQNLSSRTQVRDLHKSRFLAYARNDKISQGLGQAVNTLTPSLSLQGEGGLL